MTTSNGIRGLLLVSAVTAALGLVYPAVWAEDTVMFSYKFEEGTGHDYKVKFTQEMDYGGFAFNQFMDFEVTEKCVAVTEDGKFRMELLFNKVETSRMQFDKMEEDDSYDGLLGQSLTYLVDAHGAVTEVRAVAYVDNWARISPNITMMMQMWYAYLPGEQVEAGSGWKETKDKEDNGVGLLISTSAEFSFEGTKKEKDFECAKVKAEVEQKIEGSQAGYKTDGAGKGKYEFLFCPEKSVMVQLKSKFEIKMDMTPESGQGNDVESIVNVQMERALL